MSSQSEILFHEILNSQKGSRWLNIVFLFSAEIGAEQLKNYECMNCDQIPEQPGACPRLLFSPSTA